MSHKVSHEMQITTKIFFSEDLSKRSYVYFFINKTRFRIYNGAQFGKDCSPANQKTSKSRLRALLLLEGIVKQELKNGWLPGQKRWLVGELLTSLITEYQQSSLSQKYIRDCTIVLGEFFQYAGTNNLLENEVNELASSTFETFLLRYNSSSAYYTIKRRTICAIFEKLVQRDILKSNPVKATTRKRVEAVHNQSFTDKQLELALNAIKSSNEHMYLCVLFVYCMLLRPHREVRLLKRSNFNEDLTILTLSGNENKSKRIRSIPVPVKIREFLLLKEIHLIPDEFNIFTKQLSPLNECYFTTCWTRIKKKLMGAGIISNYHTLYSFRHTAVCSVFKKSNDLHLVQRLCSHQSMITSLKYLRSLGMEQVGSLDELPQLEF